MKKLGKKIIALAAVAVMGLSMIACGRKYKSVEAYLKTDVVQQTLEEYESQLSGTGMSIGVSADGDKMIYTFTYETIEKQDGMAESLESAVEAQASNFQDTANEMKKVISAENPSVVIEYVDCNGAVIYSREFVAE